MNVKQEKPYPSSLLYVPCVYLSGNSPIPPRACFPADVYPGDGVDEACCNGAITCDLTCPYGDYGLFMVLMMHSLPPR